MIKLKDTTFKRLYTGILGVLLLTICTIYSIEFSMLFIFIWTLCAIEYFNIFTLINDYTWKAFDTLSVFFFSFIVATPLIYNVFVLVTNKANIFSGGYDFISIYIAIILIYLLWFFSVYKISKDNNKIGIFYGSVYIAVPFLSIILIRWIFGWEAILLLFIGVWSMDIFSYTSGMRFGRHPVAPTISPKKSWEGLIGGAIGSIICFILFQSLILGIEITWLSYLFAIILPLAAFFGDLFESKIKRRAKIKDSSNLLKSHGGVLDRFDSMIFYSIVFSFYLVLVWKI
ncbi:MAG: phosphatidate cytidylyltransferase [Caldisericia bacterium]|nr:phosphatidate cytidylyltransferase [Caldisericia bacterium]